MVKNIIGKEAGGVIQRLHMIMMGKLKNTAIARRIGVNKMLGGFGTAGLCIYLAASAINSKKQVQGEY